MSTSWAPANETAAQLWNERSILIGLFLGAIGYGVHLTLFVQCVQALYARKSGRRNHELLIFVCILFALGNVGNATNILFGQKTFIDDRDYPGGPGVYFVEQSTNWSVVVCDSVYIVNSWFADGLLLYRFWTIWSRNHYIVAVPAIAFLTSMVLSAILIAELSQPGNTFWSTICIKLAIPYWSISISMTVILTALIAGRLLFMRYRFKKLVGASSSIPYVTITAMLVESATIYSMNGILFLASYGVDSPVQNLWLPLLGQTQSIAPLLIILRVARGQAWSDQTMDQLISMQFARSQATHMANDGTSTVLDTFPTGPKKMRVGGRQDLEQREDEGESESEFRVAVV
ncbi:hypothetical protein MSAN_02417100 [Mycena sanguinolenta]|uniref:Uncharacterized protein n=1 Tax=Mycena sanguinolenta TaxID=230812 RepID=A0A8H7CEK6_9AGAR|nr:hypothetical protein MSAN_02417100 [Mycena sanguinolenta]